MVLHIASKFYFIDSISVKFMCLHNAFLDFYKPLKIMLGGPDLFSGTKSMKRLNYWIPLQSVLIFKSEAARSYFVHKISSYFVWFGSAFQSFLYLSILSQFLGVGAFLIKGWLIGSHWASYQIVKKGGGAQQYLNC